MEQINYKAFKNDLKAVRTNIAEHGNVDDATLEDNKKNRDYLIHTTINMVERRAYARSGFVKTFIETADLIQNGMIGALDALDMWFRKTVDERREFANFKTFAYIWVEKHIREYVDSNSYGITHGIKQIGELHSDYQIFSGDEVVSMSADDVSRTRFDVIEDSNISSGNSGGSFDIENDVIAMDNSLKNLIESSIGEYDTRILFSYFGFSGESKKDVANTLNKDVKSLNKYCKKLILKIQENITPENENTFIELLTESHNFSL